MDFGKGYIIREKIPAFAVNKHQGEYEGKKKTTTYLNFGISKLREVDDKGNTHTVWCQEYDSEQKKSVGDKVYIGRCKEIQTQFNEGETVSDAQIVEDDDLPF